MTFRVLGYEGRTLTMLLWYAISLCAVSFSEMPSGTISRFWISNSGGQSKVV